MDREQDWNDRLIQWGVQSGMYRWGVPPGWLYHEKPLEEFARLAEAAGYARGRKAALEEAKELCEHLSTRAGDAMECAEAINALRSKP